MTAEEAVILTTVSLDAQGVATYNLYGPETADWGWRARELPEPARLDAAAVHTGLATAHRSVSIRERTCVSVSV